MSLKVKTLRSQEYLSFVRGHSCLILGTDYGVVAHHVRMAPHGGGMGLKPSDYRTVPLNQLKHSELHAIGEKTFWKKYGVVPELAMCEMLRLWLLKRYGVSVSAFTDVETALPFIDYVEKFLTQQE